MNKEKNNELDIEKKLAQGNKLIFYPDEKVPVTVSMRDEEEGAREGKARTRFGKYFKSEFGSFLPRRRTMRFRIWMSFMIMTVILLAIALIACLIVFDVSQPETSVRFILPLLFAITIVLLVGALFAAYFVSGFVVGPYRRLSAALRVRDEDGERKPLELAGLSDVDELIIAFNETLDSVESNNQFRRDLLANVSHDMRTPLTMISAYAEMIRDITAGDREKSERSASTIISETARLNTLINEVMELSKLEAGVIELNAIAFDYTEKVTEVIATFTGLSEAKGYNVKVEIEDGLYTLADPNNIDRVLYNLIGNAINYTGDDKTVYVVCKATGNVIETHVYDTGKGIAKDDLVKVWDKYYRRTQDKRRILGSGLGLSIVKSILELHSVEYGVISDVGKGSDFYFCLPLIANPRAPAPTTAQTIKKSPIKKSSTKKSPAKKNPVKKNPLKPPAKNISNPKP